MVGKNDDDGSLRVRIILEDGQVIEGNAVEVDQ